MPIDWSEDPQSAPAWRREPLAIAPSMSERMKAARALHNARIAHDDALFGIEHQLAARHFEAVANVDEAGAAAALEDRIALGFSVD